MTSFARWVSIVAHPFVMIAVMVGAAAARLGPPGEMLRTIGLVALFTIVPVAALTVRQIRRGAWENIDASHPRERPALYAVGLAGMLALVIYLVVFRPNSFLLRGSGVTLVLLALCAIVTRWVKVSLHMASAALVATTLILLGSVVGWLVAAAIPVLAWSRLALGRHKSLEVVLGFVFGVAAGVAVHFRG